MFTVYTEPPSLLHLAGELDLAGAPALTAALEPLTSRGGTIGMDLTRLTFMDSTGINALCQAAQALGERGRVVAQRDPSGSARHRDGWPRPHHRRPHRLRGRHVFAETTTVPTPPVGTRSMTACRPHPPATLYGARRRPARFQHRRPNRPELSSRLDQRTQSGTHHNRPRIISEVLPGSAASAFPTS